MSNVIKKQTIIIIDGPDGNGKTTIAHALGSAMLLPVYKNSHEHNAYANDQSSFVMMLKHHDAALVDFLAQTGHSVIMDRGYPSEWVYSRVMGRLTDTNVLQRRDREYAALGALVVIPLRSSYVGCDKAFADINAGRRQELHDSYVTFSEWTLCETLILCVDDEDTSRHVATIAGMCDARSCDAVKVC